MLTDNFGIHYNKKTREYIVHVITDMYDIVICGSFNDCMRYLRLKGVL